jgi:hypothetical protein
MATQVFHFSNTGVSSGQRFYLREDQSRILLRNLVLDSNSSILGSNLVYNTGNQTISGVKTFSSGTAVGLATSASPVTLNTARGLQFPNIGGNGDGVIYGAYNGYNKIGIGISPAFSAISEIIEFNPTQILGRVPILASNLVYNTGNQTISGVKTFASRPTVNGTGFLLSGQNCFIVNLYNTSDTQSLGHNYFGNLSMGFSSNQNNRRFPVLEACVVRRATWTQVHGSIGAPAQNSTGYFVNTTTNTTGIISTTLNSTSSATTYTAEFSPPIIISNGDQIVCSLFGPSYTTFPGTVRNSVNLYCYN